MFGRRLGVGLGILAALLVGGCGGDGGSGGGGATSSVSTPGPVGTVQINQTLARTVSTFVASFRFTFFDEGGNVVLGPTQTARVASIRIPGVPVTARTLVIDYLSSTGATIGRFEGPVTVTEGGTTPVDDPAWVDVAPTAATFGAATTWAVGNGPYDLVVGDFDGDGDADFATANAEGNDVTVCLGDGQGAFAAPVAYAVSSVPIGINTGFLNGDGHLDLVVGNAGSDSVSFLAGTGDGTFQPQVAIPAAGPPSHPAIEDFDGNGTLDLGIATFQGKMVQLLLNDGAGNFTPRLPVSTDPNDRQRNVAADDFDDDGDVDVAASSEVVAGRYSVLLNVGDGFLGPATVTAIGAFGFVSWVEAADLDGDAKVDLALGAGQATLFARGNGDGTFAPVVQVGESSGQVAVADLNGDGRPDLVGQDGSRIRVLLGNGDGTFVASELTAPAVTQGVRVADFNGDGRPDILAIQFASDNAVLFLQD